MSADNGIYILKTPLHKDETTGVTSTQSVYRVADCAAIENISREDGSIDTCVLKDYFGKSKCFLKEDLALAEALDIYKSSMFCEYGIQLIELQIVFPV